MGSPFTLPAIFTPPLTGREAVIDALHRCVLAFDTNNPALFDSTFTADGIFEINGRAMIGLPEIHATGLVLVFSVDTTHLVSNVRVNMKTEDEASLTATVLAQHFAGGKGMEADQKNLLSGSLYRAELIRGVDGLWKFKHLLIKSTWVQGDYSVIGGNFSEQ